MRILFFTVIVIGILFSLQLLKIGHLINQLKGTKEEQITDKENKTHLPNIPAYIVCRAFKICSNFYEISYFFYLLSLLFQFLIFFKFDKNFNIGYNDIKAKIRQKLFNN